MRVCCLCVFVLNVSDTSMGNAEGMDTSNDKGEESMSVDGDGDGDGDEDSASVSSSGTGTTTPTATTRATRDIRWN